MGILNQNYTFAKNYEEFIKWHLYLLSGITTLNPTSQAEESLKS
jgi:hypothetical protein